MNANYAIAATVRCGVCKGWGYFENPKDNMPWHPHNGVRTCGACEGTGRKDKGQKRRKA